MISDEHSGECMSEKTRTYFFDRRIQRVTIGVSGVVIFSPFLHVSRNGYALSRGVVNNNLNSMTHGQNLLNYPRVLVLSWQRREKIAS